MKPVIIHSEARRELDNAIQYYEKQKIGLGLDLLSEIEQALEKIKIIVISNKNETLGDTISTNNFIKGCPHRSIHSCPL